MNQVLTPKRESSDDMWNNLGYGNIVEKVEKDRAKQSERGTIRRATRAGSVGSIETLLHKCPSDELVDLLESLEDRSQHALEVESAAKEENLRILEVAETLSQRANICKEEAWEFYTDKKILLANGEWADYEKDPNWREYSRANTLAKLADNFVRSVQRTESYIRTGDKAAQDQAEEHEAFLAFARKIAFARKEKK